MAAGPGSDTGPTTGRSSSGPRSVSTGTVSTSSAGVAARCTGPAVGRRPRVGASAVDARSAELPAECAVAVRNPVSARSAGLGNSARAAHSTGAAFGACCCSVGCCSASRCTANVGFGRRAADLGKRCRAIGTGSRSAGRPGTELVNAAASPASELHVDPARGAAGRRACDTVAVLGTGCRRTAVVPARAIGAGPDGAVSNAGARPRYWLARSRSSRGCSGFGRADRCLPDYGLPIGGLRISGSDGRRCHTNRVRRWSWRL